MAEAYRYPYTFDRIDQRTKKVTPALIHAVTMRITDHLHPKRVILFGSQVNQNSREERDIDLLICLDDKHPLANLNKGDRALKVLNLFPYRSFGLDVIVLTQGDIEEIQKANEGEWDLVLEILAQGKILYERPEASAAE